MEMEAKPIALWHFTRLPNLDSILQQSRLLSHAAALRMGIRPSFVSDDASRKEDLANGRANFVFLSLAPYSPFFRKTAFHSPHAWLRLSPDVLELPGVKVKFGASQSKYNVFNDLHPQALRSPMLLLGLERRIKYRSDGGPDYSLFRLDSRLDSLTWGGLSTEILVPESIDLSASAEGIYLVNAGKVSVLLHPLRRTPHESIAISAA